jgi:hypothetical protein
MTEGWEQLRQNTQQKVFEATKRSNKVWTELLHGEPRYFDRIYNHYQRDMQQLDCSVSTVQPTTNPTIFHKVYIFCPFGQDDMAGIVESATQLTPKIERTS